MAPPHPSLQVTGADGKQWLIDPRRLGDGFLDRIEALVEQLRDAGTGRLPGDLRYERRRVAERDGIEVSPEMHVYLTRKGRHVSAA
jgi:LDH2 family malate/lactate/ureidoglycolate dehydrogenase